MSSPEVAALASLPLWYRVAAALVGATAEELVWRGYAIERLSELTRSTQLAATISLAASVAIHIPAWGVVGALIKVSKPPWPGHLAAEISRAAAAAISASQNVSVCPDTSGVRCRAGGLARAKDAWRYSDGTFMPNSEKEALIEDDEREQYERYAAGGRARAAKAQSGTDGTFL